MCGLDVEADWRQLKRIPLTLESRKMPTARELLISAIDGRRPIVLLLGQSAWVDSEQGDPVLETALNRLGRSIDPNSGWSAMLSTDPVPTDHFEWLTERFERRVQPPSIEVISELPWSAVFTSSIDPTLTALMSRGGQQAEPILMSTENPPAARSTARPPLYFLFSRAGEHDPEARPPKDRIELNARRIQHAVPLLNRMLDTATALGTVIVDGFLNGDDWLRYDDLFGVLANATSGQILWFGGIPQLSEEHAAIFEAMVRSHRIVLDRMRLGTAIAELGAIGRLADVITHRSDHVGVVTFRNGRSLEATPEDRLRVRGGGIDC